MIYFVFQISYVDKYANIKSIFNINNGHLNIK